MAKIILLLVGAVAANTCLSLHANQPKMLRLLGPVGMTLTGANVKAFTLDSAGNQQNQLQYDPWHKAFIVTAQQRYVRVVAQAVGLADAYATIDTHNFMTVSTLVMGQARDFWYYAGSESPMPYRPQPGRFAFVLTTAEPIDKLNSADIFGADFNLPGLSVHLYKRLLSDTTMYLGLLHDEEMLGRPIDPLYIRERAILRAARANPAIQSAGPIIYQVPLLSGGEDISFLTNHMHVTFREGVKAEQALELLESLDCTKIISATREYRPEEFYITLPSHLGTEMNVIARRLAESPLVYVLTSGRFMELQHD